MVFTGQFDHPSAWKCGDFKSKDDFSFDFDERHRDAFRSMLARVGDSGLSVTELTAEHAAMPDIEDDLCSIRREITHGRGLVVVRGFPIDEMDERELSTVFWAIGSHFGHAVSQSPLGDRLGYVTDVSNPHKMQRAYRTAGRLNLHTDSDEIVGLLCIRQAMAGGYSRLASAVTIHNKIAARRPDLLDPLYEGFRYHWFGEQSPGDPPITAYNVPVFCFVDGLLSACYIREFIRTAAWELRQPLTRQQEKALAYFDATADRRDIVLKFMLQPGEASFINNYTVLHSRTGFADWPQTDKKRLLLRLWLQTTPRRPVHANLRRFYDDRPQVQG